ncbi:hypothetical protein [Streptomyces sp. NPDC051776]|uniref:hypothetical protein n=1 Tax=Streptomyces sp. NPDC051776 TaxID=3155414 RepID=UPI00341E4876
MRAALPEVDIVTAVDADGINAGLHDGATSWATPSALSNGLTLACQGGLADWLTSE